MPEQSWWLSTLLPSIVVAFVAIFPAAEKWRSWGFAIRVVIVLLCTSGVLYSSYQDANNTTKNLRQITDNLTGLKLGDAQQNARESQLQDHAKEAEGIALQVNIMLDYWISRAAMCAGRLPPDNPNDVHGSELVLVNELQRLLSWTKAIDKVLAATKTTPIIGQKTTPEIEAQLKEISAHPAKDLFTLQKRWDFFHTLTTGAKLEYAGLQAHNLRFPANLQMIESAEFLEAVKKATKVEPPAAAK
jgi:hypothetical protein